MATQEIGEYADEVRIRRDGLLTAVVGSFDNPFPPQHAFVHCPVFKATQATDLNAGFFPPSGEPVGTIPATFPPGYYLGSAKEINNQMVVVGNLAHEESGSLRGFAIDLSIWPPVLDLLPTAGCFRSKPSGSNLQDQLDAYDPHALADPFRCKSN